MFIIAFRINRNSTRGKTLWQIVPLFGIACLIKRNAIILKNKERSGLGGVR